MAQQDEQIQDAFRLGWRLVELMNRIQLQQLKDLYEKSAADQSQAAQGGIFGLGIDSGDALLRSSLWGSMLNDIAHLHWKHFPDNNVGKTFYNLPDQNTTWFLYKQDNTPPEENYMDLGMQSAVEGKEKLSDKFPIFDITLRTLNCLSLLYQKAADSLIWDTIDCYQQALLTTLTGTNLPTGKRNPQQTLPAPPASLAPYFEKLSETDPTQPALNRSIWQLTAWSVHLIEAWTSQIQAEWNAIGIRDNNEFALVAFEAGRNMATISWCLSVDLAGRSLASLNSNNPSATIYSFWEKRLSPENIIKVQHQISALANKLDDLYYAGKERPVSDNPNGAPPLDPEAPGASINAIKQSLDYWQRTVEWLHSKEAGACLWNQRLKHKQITDAQKSDYTDKCAADLLDGDFENLRVALIEQSNIWFDLITRRQPLSAYSVESISRAFYSEIISDMQVVASQELMQGAQDFGEQAKEVVALTSSVVNEITEEAKDGFQGLVQTIKPFMTIVWIVAGIALVGALAFLALSLMLPQQNFADGQVMTGLLSALAGFMGFQGWRHANAVSNDAQKSIDEKAKQPALSVAPTTQPPSDDSQQGSSLFSRISSSFGSLAQTAEEKIVKALNDGYAEIKKEVRRLEYNVGMTYPLVEFCVLHFNLEGDLDFLKKVIWTDQERAEEIQNITSAAFGSIGLLAGVGHVGGPLVASISNVKQGSTKNELRLYGSVQGDHLASWQLYYKSLKDASQNGAGWLPIGIQQTRPVVFGQLGVFTKPDTSGPDEKFMVRVSAKDTAGASTDSSIQIPVATALPK